MGSQRQEGGPGAPLTQRLPALQKLNVWGGAFLQRPVGAELRLRVMSTRHTRVPQTAGQLRAQEKEPSASGGWGSAAGAAGGSLGQTHPLSFLGCLPWHLVPITRTVRPLQVWKQRATWGLPAQGPAGAPQGSSGVARVFPHLRPPAAFALFAFFLPTPSPPPPTKPFLSLAGAHLPSSLEGPSEPSRHP